MIKIEVTEEQMSWIVVSLQDKAREIVEFGVEMSDDDEENEQSQKELKEIDEIVELLDPKRKYREG